MSQDDQKQPEVAPDDLDVPDEQAEEVKGGLKIVGVKGESRDDKHKSEIEILGW